MSRGLLVAGVLLVSNACVADLEPWASKARPDDIRRQRVERITDARHAYTVLQKGTMDGSNCRPPIGYGAWHQTWESNRQVRLENLGDTDIVNPWLSNGHNDFRTIEQIVAGALQPGMTDKEKAIAVWRWEMNHRFHAYTADDEVNDPVKVFNVYGYTLCGNDAICLSGLWRTAGLKVRPARPTGHCVTEVLYDNAWHLLDGDEHCLFLLRDNVTIASEAQIVRDHDLIKRTHTYGILAGDSRNTDEFSASLYVFDGEPGGDRDCRRGHSMDMTLRPNEAITWRWGHLKPCKFHGLQDIKDWGQNAVDKVCNGLWEYRPDLSRDVWRLGAQTVENVVAVDGVLRPAQGETGVIVWRMKSPYVFVGGLVQMQGAGADLALSWDAKDWRAAQGDLTGFFPPAGPARYGYYLRCQLPPGSELRKISITNDTQMAHLSLPGMVVGPNQFLYTDETQGPRTARITHEWVERSLSRAPKAPPLPLFPTNGAHVEGTDVVFTWQPPEDPDADAIADYHFELSNRPDIRWPLSPNFERLVSHTADKGKPRYTLPYVGLLSPYTRYYWRVRAKDARGVWGPWSEVWSFVPRGPAPPKNVHIEVAADGLTATLRWQPGNGGRQPVAYRVYGSDEKGFTVSDEPYEVNVGNQKEKLQTPFPANFVAHTRTTELPVIGASVDLPNANKAYYRVVALDANGNRSWSSDYASAPRPFIIADTAIAARAGEEFSYQIRTIRSLGDLRCRTIDKSPYNANFWDVEKPVFELLSGPDWLTMDPEGGLLHGTPDAPGLYTIELGAKVDKGVPAAAKIALTVAN